MKICYLFVLIFLCCIVRLHADNDQDTFDVSYSPSLKSEGVAVGLALGTTIIPVALGYKLGLDTGWWLVASGLVIGPSTGHFYAGQWGRGMTTAGLRAGLFAITAGYAALTFGDMFFRGSSGGGYALVAIASAAGVFGLLCTIWGRPKHR